MESNEARKSESVNIWRIISRATLDCTKAEDKQKMSGTSLANSRRKKAVKGEKTIGIDKGKINLMLYLLYNFKDNMVIHIP